MNKKSIFTVLLVCVTLYVPLSLFCQDINITFSFNEKGYEQYNVYKGDLGAVDRSGGRRVDPQDPSYNNIDDHDVLRILANGQRNKVTLLIVDLQENGDQKNAAKVRDLVVKYDSGKVKGQSGYHPADVESKEAYMENILKPLIIEMIESL